jgi:hypothetical protein
MKISKFFAGFLLLILVLGITLKMKLFFGWEIDMVLALLVVYGLVFELLPTLFFASFAAWILNSSPLPGLELVVLVGIALISYFGRYFMPWQRWVSLTLLVVLGTFSLYAVASPRLFLDNIGFITLDAGIATIFGFIVLRIFRAVFGK